MTGRASPLPRFSPARAGVRSGPDAACFRPNSSDNLLMDPRPPEPYAIYLVKSGHVILYLSAWKHGGLVTWPKKLAVDKTVTGTKPAPTDELNYSFRPSVLGAPRNFRL